ncbi:MAG: zf-HC2 domain-containing protein [Acidobacteria bacterium]|nr:zf-HC2 domain-containing protein [Acidobacteriota bacterium]
MTCAQLVELVTDYLEDALSPEDVERVEEHLVFCDGCTNYLEQMRATVAASGRLRTEDVPPELQERLLTAFRDWSRA